VIQQISTNFNYCAVTHYSLLPPTTTTPPSFSPLVSYLYFFLAALEKLPKEAEGLVYRGVGPDAVQAVCTPICTTPLHRLPAFVVLSVFLQFKLSFIGF
jgi:hypothetical protein